MRSFLPANKRQHGAILRKRHVADAHFFRNRNGELHACRGHGAPGNQPGPCGDSRERQADGEPEKKRNPARRCSCRPHRPADLGSRKRAQRKGEISRRLKTLFRIFLQAAPHNALESRGEWDGPGLDNSGGSSFKTAVMVSAGVSRRKARTPESIS